MGNGAALVVSGFETKSVCQRAFKVWVWVAIALSGHSTSKGSLSFVGRGGAVYLAV